MKKLLLIIVLTSLIFSCTQSKNNSMQKNDVTISEEETQVTLQSEQYVENDSLISLLESDLNFFIKNSKFSLEKEPVENQHVNNVVDTIKIFRSNQSKIKTYKSATEEWVFEAHIVDSEFKFLDFINIGSDITKLEKKMKIVIDSDILKIGNLEQTSVFVFKLKDRKLKEVTYEGYVD